MKHKPYGIYERFLKRVLDVISAVLALTVFCWLYAVVAFFVRIKLGSPVIFRQERPGKDNKIFYLYKFRTMTDARGANGELLPDEARLTKFGKLLRKLSLDELPEAVNILKGEMSVVGPRPLLTKYLPWYTEEEIHRHDVRPGLTGLAQISGRNAISWDEKFRLDLQYVRKITFVGDVKIIAKTVVKTFIRKEGISSATCATMEDFAEYAESR